MFIYVILWLLNQMDQESKQQKKFKMKIKKKGCECGHLQHETDIHFNIIVHVDIHNKIFH